MESVEASEEWIDLLLVLALSQYFLFPLLAGVRSSESQLFALLLSGRKFSFSNRDLES